MKLVSGRLPSSLSPKALTNLTVIPANSLSMVRAKSSIVRLTKLETVAAPSFLSDQFCNLMEFEDKMCVDIDDFQQGIIPCKVISLLFVSPLLQILMYGIPKVMIQKERFPKRAWSVNIAYSVVADTASDWQHYF